MMARLVAELPGSVLFACGHNAIRSPMAEGLMKSLHGIRVYVQSAGVRTEPLDPFAVAVMEEIGLDIARHRPRTFEDLEDDYFDLVVSLAPEAQHRAVELTRATATDLEFWNTPDPTLVEGSRAAQLDAYRLVRDLLLRRIHQRFPVPGGLVSL